MPSQFMTSLYKTLKHLNPICLTLLLSAILTLSACQISQNTSQVQTEPSINTQKSADSEDLQILEVIGVFGESDGDSVSLISLDRSQRYTTIMSIPNLGNNYVSLQVGDRVQIAGQYTRSNPPQIFNISSIKKVANPDKAKCEAKQGNVWKPQGKAQIPACISTYSDAGKPCSASTECQGDCMVKDPKQPAVCASSSSRFGCGSSIEEFNKHGGILCID